MFLEKRVGDCKLLGGRPIFHPLSTGVHWLYRVLSDDLVVVVFGCYANSGIEVGPNHYVHVFVFHFVDDCFEGVIHWLYVLIAVAAVGEVANDDPDSECPS